MKIVKLFLVPILLSVLGCTLAVERKCLPVGEGVRWTCYDRVSSGGLFDASNNSVRGYDYKFTAPVPPGKTPEDVLAKVEKVEVLPVTFANQEGLVNKATGTVVDTIAGAFITGIYAVKAAKALRPDNISVTGIAGDVKGGSASAYSESESEVEGSGNSYNANNNTAHGGQGGQGGAGGKGYGGAGGLGGSVGPINVKAEGGKGGQGGSIEKGAVANNLNGGTTTVNNNPNISAQGAGTVQGGTGGSVGPITNNNTAKTGEIEVKPTTYISPTIHGSTVGPIYVKPEIEVEVKPVTTINVQQPKPPSQCDHGCGKDW